MRFTTCRWGSFVVLRRVPRPKGGSPDSKPPSPGVAGPHTSAGIAHVLACSLLLAASSCIEPALGRAALALRAMAVPTGVVGELIRAAAIAAQQVSTECGRTALLDGRHDLELS